MFGLAKRIATAEQRLQSLTSELAIALQRLEDQDRRIAGLDHDLAGVRQHFDEIGRAIDSLAVRIEEADAAIARETGRIREETNEKLGELDRLRAEVIRIDRQARFDAEQRRQLAAALVGRLRAG